MPASTLRLPALRARRWGYFGLVTLTTAAGVWMMVHIVGAHGFTVLEAIILALFAPTFAWIVLPFWTAVAGFVLRIARLDPLTLRRVGDRSATVGDRSAAVGDWSAANGEAPVGLTALVVPVHAEDPIAVAARISDTVRSLQATGFGHRFHVHILSDTIDSDIGRREAAAWLRLRAEHPEVPIHYRRRKHNTGRKAGNIGEFCTRCVGDYDFMVVLDADSLMSGDTLVALARIMDANPDIGLIQTVPLPVRARTLFGRLVQFAGCLYGPLLATGQSFWQGDAANYWGHNAILRLRAFTEHARLPVLPGTPPLGGEVLSHDFVEGAWLRRAGWKVVLDPMLGGSWEEVPGTVGDFARRDRRWAQGSLQHLRLLGEPGLHPLSRLHFLLGAMGYVSSLLWLLILAAGTVYVALPGLHGPSLDISPIGTPIGVSLLVVTAGVLFVPKLLGVVHGIVAERARFGGAARLLGSATLETAFSVLLAPVMMLYHTRFVMDIVLGRSVEWDPHPRDRVSRSWRDAVREAALPTAVGVSWGGATLAVSPLFFLWMSPIFLGLLLSVPLLRWTGSARSGGLAEALGMLLVPSETVPSSEVGDVRTVLTAPPNPPESGMERALTLPPHPRTTDPTQRTGVHVRPVKRVAGSSQPVGRSMHHAERGLFDLRQGRPFLVTDNARGTRTGPSGTAVLVAAVEGLDPSTLRRLLAMAAGAPRLVLTTHRIAAMGLGSTNGHGPAPYALPLDPSVDLDSLIELSCGSLSAAATRSARLLAALPAETAGLSLVRLGRLLPAVVAVPVATPADEALRAALASGEMLQADASEVRDFVDAAGAEIVLVGEAPVPLVEAEDSRFMLFREAHGLQDHVAILVGPQSGWPDPVPVRLHSACLTGDLFGSLRCDCGEQLHASMDFFATRGGGVLLYLAQEGRGIGLRNKFRAYELQEGGLDTIEADGTLGFGPDERRYDVAAKILEALDVRRIELLTNNPQKVAAMEEAGITVVRRVPLHGKLNRHNLPYVRAKVQRAGHWLGDMLSQPL
jgi:membrane glycosyltransferase